MFCSIFLWRNDYIFWFSSFDLICCSNMSIHTLTSNSSQFYTLFKISFLFYYKNRFQALISAFSYYNGINSSLSQNHATPRSWCWIYYHEEFHMCSSIITESLDNFPWVSETLGHSNHEKNNWGHVKCEKQQSACSALFWGCKTESLVQQIYGASSECFPGELGRAVPTMFPSTSTSPRFLPCCRCPNIWGLIKGDLPWQCLSGRLFLGVCRS